MTKHIGIVACTAEGASLCYRTICIEGAVLMGKHSHPEISMHTFCLSKYMQYIESDDWKGVSTLMLSSAEKLAKIGADFVICPDNTIHQALDFIIEKSPVPWLHIAEEVAKVAKVQNYKCIGILGTRFLMEGPVYSTKLNDIGIEHKIPDAKDREHINDIIFNELVYGNILSVSHNYFNEVIKKLKEDGCDAVVLGCTEIPLIVTPESSPLPTLDSTRLLARAALKKAIET